MTNPIEQYNNNLTAIVNELRVNLGFKTYKEFLNAYYPHRYLLQHLKTPLDHSCSSYGLYKFACLFNLELVLTADDINIEHLGDGVVTSSFRVASTFFPYSINKY